MLLPEESRNGGSLVGCTRVETTGGSAASTCMLWKRKEKLEERTEGQESQSRAPLGDVWRSLYQFCPAVRVPWYLDLDVLRLPGKNEANWG